MIRDDLTSTKADALRPAQFKRDPGRSQNFQKGGWGEGAFVEINNYDGEESEGLFTRAIFTAIYNTIGKGQ